MSSFLEELSSKAPVPGGGAVASLVGALGAALGSMVLAYSVGKKSLVEHEGELRRAVTALERTREVLLELSREDAEAYAWLNALMKLPEDDPKRQAEYETAVAAAIQAPRSTLGASCDALRLLESLCGKTNRHLRSDLAIAGILAEAAARSAWWNVAVNLPLLDSPAERESVEYECRSLLADAGSRADRIQDACLAVGST